MFTKFWYIRVIDPAVYWVLFGSVWMIYVVDRIRDAWKKGGKGELRHEFHWRHRKILLFLVALVFIGCVFGFLTGIPTTMVWNWPRGYPGDGMNPQGLQLLIAIFISLVTHGGIVLLFTAAFFLVGKNSEEGVENAVIKNVFAALTFAFGTASGAHFYQLHGPLPMLYSFEVLAFAFVCLLNLNAIDIWEEEDGYQEEGIGVRDFALTLPLLVIGFLSLLAAHFWDAYRKPFFYSILVASAALLMLDRYRNRLSKNLLRVLADVALLLPLPIFWFWFRA